MISTKFIGLIGLYVDPALFLHFGEGPLFFLMVAYQYLRLFSPTLALYCLVEVICDCCCSYVPMFGETEYDPTHQFCSVSIEEQLDALSRAVAAGKVSDDIMGLY